LISAVLEQYFNSYTLVTIIIIITDCPEADKTLANTSQLRRPTSTTSMSRSYTTPSTRSSCPHVIIVIKHRYSLTQELANLVLTNVRNCSTLRPRPSLVWITASPGDTTIESARSPTTKQPRRSVDRGIAVIDYGVQETRGKCQYSVRRRDNYYCGLIVYRQQENHLRCRRRRRINITTVATRSLAHRYHID